MEKKAHFPPLFCCIFLCRELPRERRACLHDWDSDSELWAAEEAFSLIFSQRPRSHRGRYMRYIHPVSLPSAKYGSIQPVRNNYFATNLCGTHGFIVTSGVRTPHVIEDPHRVISFEQEF